jgi:hypothetical protein
MVEVEKGEVWWRWRRVKYGGDVEKEQGGEVEVESGGVWWRRWRGRMEPGGEQ